LQAVALRPLPLTRNESMLAKPPLVVDTRLMLLAPAFNVAAALPEFVHVPASTLPAMPS
jgi:hypothetical protein